MDYYKRLEKDLKKGYAVLLETSPALRSPGSARLRLATPSGCEYALIESPGYVFYQLLYVCIFAIL